MRCPNCKNENTQPINHEKSHYYCPKCNSAFKKGQTTIDQGNMSFNGVVDAKKIFDILTGENPDITPELRTALETQMTSIIFEQWFEGFKAGQLANIAYTKDYYDNGKTRNRSKSSTERNEDGSSGIRTKTPERERDGEECHARKQDRPTKGSYSLLRVLVSGVEVKYPSHVQIPENVHVEIAETIDKVGKDRIRRLEYDGSGFSILFKTGTGPA